jgi:hypothetical protein
MTDETHDQILEAMLRTTGEWVILRTWSSEHAEYDALGWIEKWGERVGSSRAPLPQGGHVDLTAFCAVRAV